jgi:aminopeptidase N
MQLEARNTKGIRFELPGSQQHHPPIYPYSIDHIRLKIEPNLNAGAIKGEATIFAKALAEISTCELDAVDLDVSSVVDKTKSKLAYETHNDKLVINLGTRVSPNNDIILTISYTASPRKGFYFIRPDTERRLEAWTQGESNEARHWFPSIDHPQAKFKCDIDIVVPSQFQVISNGIRKGTPVQTSDKTTIHQWFMNRPIPAYLVSIVIGEYQLYQEKGNLFLYVPKGIKEEDRNRTFARTADMINFFKDYFKMCYPYEKYSQVTVQDFITKGMENASCTTLTVDTIHDKRVEVDYPSENLISHEIAHQWFGDLVTCRDWQDLWLNESFATYCEALYQESRKGKDEYHQLMIENADTYFEEAGSRYIRPIVTNVYKHPDDLFDTHSYEKGACIINMLRHLIGDEDFNTSIRKYLENFADKTADTHDLINVLQSVTEKNLKQFFDQWIFRAGHPELEVEFISDNNMSRVRISQVQSGDLFDFNIEIKIAFGKDTEQIFKVNLRSRESILSIPTEGRAVDWFSIDPEFKNLAKIVSIKAPQELLINQLRLGRTIFECVQAARALKAYSSLLVVTALKDAILSDKFWFVRAEAARSLGTVMEEYAYDALKECLTKVEDPRVRRALVAAIGAFRRKETIDMLKPVLDSNTESYAVQSQVATAMGKTKEPQMVAMLKAIIEDKETYLDLVARGAIAGLKEFAGDNDVASFILEKSKYGNRQKIREAATSALGKFAAGDKRIADDLRNVLLRDKWFRIRKNACIALAEAEITDAISDLKWVADHDIDAGVRRVADECVISLEEKLELSKRRILQPAEVGEIMEEQLRKKRAMHIEFLSRMDSYHNREC